MDKKKLENIFFTIIAIVVIGFSLYSFLFDTMEHIEDRNGESNNNIAIITNSEIIEQKMSSVGMKKSESNLEIGGIQLGDVKFHSEKFSGVEPLLQTNIMFSSNYSIDIYNYQINSGNFGLYVLLDGKIIDILKPQEDITYYLGDIKGELTIVAVGESADFQFEMTHSEFSEYYHFTWE